MGRIPDNTRSVNICIEEIARFGLETENEVEHVLGDPQDRSHQVAQDAGREQDDHDHESVRLEPRIAGRERVRQQAHRDATAVDKTWKYVNKDGEQDRRFNDNREIPVLQYLALRFTSDSGLNELVYLSRSEAEDDVEDFKVSLEALGMLAKPG